MEWRDSLDMIARTYGICNTVASLTELRLNVTVRSAFKAPDYSGNQKILFLPTKDYTVLR